MNEPYVDPYAARMTSAVSAHEAVHGRAAKPRDHIDQVASVGNGNERRASANRKAASKGPVDPKTAKLVEDALVASGLHDWHDVPLAVSLLDLTGCVGVDGEPNLRAVEAAAIRLVRDKPWLVREPSVPDVFPMGASGQAVGSGRKRYGRRSLDADALRKKYPAL